MVRVGTSRLNAFELKAKRTRALREPRAVRNDERRG
jgi:hypothetical protein